MDWAVIAMVSANREAGAGLGLGDAGAAGVHAAASVAVPRISPLRRRSRRNTVTQPVSPCSCSDGTLDRAQRKKGAALRLGNAC